MKKIIALVLICVMCLGICSCGASEEVELYEKYEDIISALEKGKYDKAIEKINKLEEKENKKDKDDGNGGDDLSDGKIANNMYAEVVGEWISRSHYYDEHSPSLIINVDKTAEYDGITYTTELTLLWGDTLQVALCDEDERAYEIQFGVDEDGFKHADVYEVFENESCWVGSFDCANGYEKVEITLDNFYDYFEFVERIEQYKNEFDEVIGISINKYYMFKSEYGVVNEYISDVAVEYGYTYEYYEVECDAENSTYEIIGYYYENPDNEVRTETTSFENIAYESNEYGACLTYSSINDGADCEWLYDNFEVVRVRGTIYFSK